MSEPFIGEVAIFANTFIPEGWLACNGQTVLIAQYQALYSIIGITYGGDGKNNFKLPDLRGRAPAGVGTAQPGVTIARGAALGAETVTLSQSMIPPHTHQLSRKSPKNVSAKGAVATSASDTGVIALAATNTALMAMAANTAVNTTLAAATIGSTGGGGAHENRQPYLSLLFGIAYDGIYPMRP